jgi:metal-sulfur cluster biosynthetic enzyme
LSAQSSTGEAAVQKSEQVWDALALVYDPCSQAWGRPLSIVDLGLVREVRAEEGRVVVQISLTAPYCMAVPTIMRAAERKIAEVAGIEDVRVDVDIETPWDPSLMSARGREWLARQRARDRERGDAAGVSELPAPVHPQSTAGR